jgi:hypothetical protein
METDHAEGYGRQLQVGGKIEAAVLWFISLQRSCQTQLVAEAATKPIMIDGADAKFTYRSSATPSIGWVQGLSYFLPEETYSNGEPLK